MDHKERIKQIRSAGIADNTIKSYEKDLKYFWGWAKLAKNVDLVYPVPARLLEDFLLDHIEGLDWRTDAMMIEFGFKTCPGKHAITTIRRRLEALGWVHRIKNLENPGRTKKIKDILSAGQRIESKNGRMPKKSRAITKNILDKMLKTINTTTLVGKRNKAILEFGFYTGGRRRSEIASAQYRFLTKNRGGYIYLLHRSKTDQSGKGRQKILRSRYSHSLTAWISAANITDGYLFRSIRRNKISENPINPQVVNQIIKEHVEMIGENPKYYSAHGLRRGFITTCARKRISIFDIMELTDHKSIVSLQGYYEEGRTSINPATRI